MSCLLDALFCFFAHPKSVLARTGAKCQFPHSGGGSGALASTRRCFRFVCCLCGDRGAHESAPIGVAHREGERRPRSPPRPGGLVRPARIPGRRRARRGRTVGSAAVAEREHGERVSSLCAGAGRLGHGRGWRARQRERERCIVGAPLVGLASGVNRTGPHVLHHLRLNGSTGQRLNDMLYINMG